MVTSAESPSLGNSSTFNHLYHPFTRLIINNNNYNSKHSPNIVYRSITLPMYNGRRRRYLQSVASLAPTFSLGLILGLLIFSKWPSINQEDYVEKKCITKFNLNDFSWRQQSYKDQYSNQHTSAVQRNNITKSLLFVGVMTAKKYLPTRATAVYETWGKDVPGNIEFFSSEDSLPPENRPDLPLVPLKGVDDSYPPQKKSFLMLQYMWEQHGTKYEWFLRADDDVYIRSDRIESFLRSIDSRKPHFIGQAGRGNQEEFGLLSLEYDENFCMGGPGVIMSRETLARVAPHVKYCLKNLYTTHEDVELGRCVQKFAGIPCTWSYEVNNNLIIIIIY
ncbi:hypothetical protein O3M35_008500 [Rhynocoris fuscipes]|uniref:N-acetylgalactosaminyl-proteoglycan 3-beta-glucuronosyltransferase n=1 Tax=Rhynocoris fuscipes TaxID=488301 RepID=A0AAW1D6G3_9HEMI